MAGGEDWTEGSVASQRRPRRPTQAVDNCEHPYLLEDATLVWRQFTGMRAAAARFQAGLTTQ